MRGTQAFRTSWKGSAFPSNNTIVITGALFPIYGRSQDATKTRRREPSGFNTELEIDPVPVALPREAFEVLAEGELIHSCLDSENLAPDVLKTRSNGL
jgi:hypothetical protein